MHSLTLRRTAMHLRIRLPANVYHDAFVSSQAKVAVDGKPGFFAIASAPGASGPDGTVELLIKSQVSGFLDSCPIPLSF